MSIAEAIMVWIVIVSIGALLELVSKEDK